MKPKRLEIFIPGPAGRLEAKYYKSPKFGSPVAIVLHPHPQYGGTMNNRIVQLLYNVFLENGFSVIKVNFRGVGKSEGVFDNGQGELSDAAAALDWIERQNLDYSGRNREIFKRKNCFNLVFNMFSSQGRILTPGSTWESNRKIH